MTAGDLAGFWPDDLVGFRVKRGRVMWEDARASRGETSVRIARLEVTDAGLRQVNAWVPWETEVEPVWR